VLRRAPGHGRGASAALVVHAALPSLEREPGARSAEADQTPRVGLAVPKAVGGSVVRNRVRRRLRALSAQRIGSWPTGSQVVIRALAPAASTSFADLGAELDRAAAVAFRRAGRAAGS